MYINIKLLYIHDKIFKSDYPLLRKGIEIGIFHGNFTR
jgi:hypothetical protein